MTWVKHDDGFSQSRKVFKLNDKAYRLHFCALEHCARHLTDGTLTEPELAVVAATAKAKTWRRYATELVGGGLWREIDEGFEINDFLEYNPSAAEVKEQRKRNADRQRRHREVRNAVTDAVTNGVSHAAPAPVPSRPLKVIKAVEPAFDEKRQEVQRLMRHLSRVDEGTEGVLMSLARKLPLSSVAKVRESCQTRKVGAGYAVSALQAELADLEEMSA